MPGLLGDAGEELLQHLLGRLDAQRRQHFRPDLLAGQEHQAAFVQRQIAESTGMVAAGGLQQSGEQTGAQVPECSAEIGFASLTAATSEPGWGAPKVVFCSVETNG